jgi:hypothetical protein
VSSIGRGVAVGVAVRGRSHEARGIGCEDVVLTREGPVTIAALADGAGSARHARLGAETAARAVVELLAREFAALQDAGPAVARDRMLEVIDAALACEAQVHGAHPRDLASTLLFVAMSHGRVIGGQLGDGVVAVRRKGRFEVVFEPAVGEFAGETVFVPTRRSAGDLRLFTGPIVGIDGVALMSDGAAASLCGALGRAGSLSERYRLAPILDRWWGGLATHAPSEVRGAVEDALRGPVRARTGDDCSLALVRRVGFVDATAFVSPARRSEMLGASTCGAARIRGRLARAWSEIGASAELVRLARRARVSVRKARPHHAALQAIGWG